MQSLSGDSFAWDLTGDGQYTDATGPNVTLSWNQLQALGITTAGTYPISVQITNNQNTQQYNGQTYQASAAASAPLTVNDTLPTVTAPSGQAFLGTPFSIPLSASDPGHEPITSWSVDWGDGSTETFGASASRASHIYTEVHSYSIVITASQDQLDTASKAVSIPVLPGADSISLPALHSIPAGTDLQVSASVLGTPSTYDWTISGPGGSAHFTTTTPTLDEPWSDLGLIDGGTYALDLAATYTINSQPYVVNASTSLDILNVAPSGTLSASTPSLNQGSPVGSVTLSVSSITDPAPGASNPQYTVAYDFNNDGSLDTGFLAASTAEPIPAADLLTPGTLTVRAVLQAPNGVTRDLYTNIDVLPVAPSLTLSTPSAINEGSTASLNLALSGVQLAVNQWQIQWGDGHIDTVTGNPSLDTITGAGSLSRTFAHTYANNLLGNAPYTITVSADTTSGPVIQTTQAVVNDVAPTVSLSTPTPSVVLGQPNAFTLDLAVTDPGADIVSGFSVNWGDGQTQTVLGDPSSLTHTYNTDSPDSIQVTSLTNNDGSFTNLSNTLTVSVTRPTPIIDSNLSTYDLQLISWTDGAAVPTSAQNLILVGTDPNGLLHIRTYGPSGAFADTVETQADSTSPLYLKSTNASGNVLSNLPESSLSSAQTSALSDLKASLPDLLPPHVLTDSERSQILSQTTAVLDRPHLTQVPPIGAQGTPLLLSAVATSVQTGSESLNFNWTVTGPNGQTTTFTSTSATVSKILADPIALPGYQYAQTSNTSFTPLLPGAYSVSLSVADSLGTSTSQSWTIDVANVSPSINTVSVPTDAPAGQPLTLSATASDPGGNSDPLSYTWTITEALTGHVQTLTGTDVTFTPRGGTYNVQLEVDDSFQGSATAVSTLSVVNTGPAITTFAVPTSARKGQSVTYTAAASDPAGLSDPLTYVWTVTDPAGQLSTASGLTFDETYHTPGKYVVMLSVTDALGLSASQSTTVTVDDVAPSITSTSVPTSGTEGQPLTFSAAATNGGGPLEPVFYTWTISGPNNQTTYLSGPNPTFTPPDNGTYAVSLSVADTLGTSTTLSLSPISVKNLAPSLQPIVTPTAPVHEGDIITLSVPAASDVPADLPSLTYTWTLSGPDGNPIAFTPARHLHPVPRPRRRLLLRLRLRLRQGRRQHPRIHHPLRAQPPPHHPEGHHPLEGLCEQPPDLLRLRLRPRGRPAADLHLDLHPILRHPHNPSGRLCLLHPPHLRSPRRRPDRHRHRRRLHPGDHPLCPHRLDPHQPHPLETPRRPGRIHPRPPPDFRHRRPRRHSRNHLDHHRPQRLLPHRHRSRCPVHPARLRPLHRLRDRFRHPRLRHRSRHPLRPQPPPLDPEDHSPLELLHQPAGPTLCSRHRPRWIVRPPDLSVVDHQP